MLEYQLNKQTFLTPEHWSPWKDAEVNRYEKKLNSSTSATILLQFLFFLSL